MIALHFSGGKDSLACLYLNRNRLGDILVMWLDTGKNFPCVLETIKRARAMCPNWETVHSDQDAVLREFGMPSDVVPVDSTAGAQQFVQRRGLKVQNYLDCCSRSQWMPLWRASMARGVTEIIRGQRADELHKAPVTDGQIVDGVKISLPVEKWSGAEVLRYLKQQMGELPEHLLLDHSSMDCSDCTAYWPALRNRREFVRLNYPEMHAQQEARMQTLRAEIGHYMETFPE